MARKRSSHLKFPDSFKMVGVSVFPVWRALTEDKSVGFDVYQVSNKYFMNELTAHQGFVKTKLIGNALSLNQLNDLLKTITSKVVKSRKPGRVGDYAYVGMKVE